MFLPDFSKIGLARLPRLGGMVLRDFLRRALARLHRGSDRGHPSGSPTVTKQWSGEDLGPVVGLVIIGLADEVAPAPASAAAPTSPESVQQLEVIARDLAVVRRSVEQLTDKQEQRVRNIAAMRASSVA